MYNLMERIKMKVKRWGNSFGIIVPKGIIKRENLHHGSEINVIIQPNNKTKVKDIFGILEKKHKKTTAELMKEVDKELWPEDQ